MSIFNRRIKLKARRVLRKQRRQMEAVTEQADDGIERLFFRRFSRLLAVRRFVVLWSLFVIMLSAGSLWQVRALNQFYLTTKPIDGGTYREGIIGTYTNSNPLFAVSSVDSSVSKLLYSGLFTVSPSGELVGDLASGVKVDDTGKIYTVTLRDDIKWHDGVQFNATDVLFTYNLIKNPNVKSPLYSSWRSVKVTRVDDKTVVFELPNSFSSFKYSLTNGIVPKHILGNLDIEDLRSSSFNTVGPIGTGPFKFRNLEVIGSTQNDRHEQIFLNRNDNYHNGVPHIDSVTIKSYQFEEDMINDFKKQSIQFMVGLSSVSDEITDLQNVKIISMPLTSSVMIFLNNSNIFLSNRNVRRALVQATDVQNIRDGLGYEAVPSDSPFLRNQFAYNPEITQLPYDLEKAKTILDDEGWIVGEDGFRYKDAKQLTLRLVSQSLSEYAVISQKLQQQWEKLGVNVEAILLPEEDIQSGTISRHEYDVLLYGISIGYDPDVFAYWHSSQADSNATTRLNLSEYKSDVADESLEAGRTRTDKDLRTIKYKQFLQTWQDDAPAIALYQPRFLMVARGTFEGFASGQVSSMTDRFRSITDWKIRNAEVFK